MQNICVPKRRGGLIPQTVIFTLELDSTVSTAFHNTNALLMCFRHSALYTCKHSLWVSVVLTHTG